MPTRCRAHGGEIEQSHLAQVLKNERRFHLPERRHRTYVDFFGREVRGVTLLDTESVFWALQETSSKTAMGPNLPLPFWLSRRSQHSAHREASKVSREESRSDLKEAQEPQDAGVGAGRAAVLGRTLQQKAPRTQGCMCSLLSGCKRVHMHPLGGWAMAFIFTSQELALYLPHNRHQHTSSE